MQETIRSHAGASFEISRQTTHLSLLPAREQPMAGAGTVTRKSKSNAGNDVDANDHIAAEYRTTNLQYPKRGQRSPNA